MPASQKARDRRPVIFAAVLGAAALATTAALIIFFPNDPPKPAIVAPAPTPAELARQQRNALLDQIPSAPTANPVASAQPKPPAPKPGLGPITLAPPPGAGNARPTPAPISLADGTLKVGDPATADPTEFALHPSHFADPAKLVKKIGLAKTLTGKIGFFCGGEEQGAEGSCA